MPTNLTLRTAALGAVLALAASSVPAAVAAPATAAPPDERASQAEDFDLQSHRGGRAEWTESSLTAFSRSLELGVTTLELDTHLTQDDVVMVWHDDTIQPEKCQDTGPVTPGDPDYPYVGDRFRELTYAQIQTLDCGYQQLPGYPVQDNIEGNRIATLEEVFAVAVQHGAQDEIRWNIETKVEDPANAPEREALVDGVMATIQEHGWPERTTLQSFDWAALDQVREIDPDMTLVALAESENPVGAGIDPRTVAHVRERIVEEAALAESVGLDFFGVGEHHRPDFSISAPERQPRPSMTCSLASTVWSTGSQFTVPFLR